MRKMAAIAVCGAIVLGHILSAHSQLIDSPPPKKGGIQKLDSQLREFVSSTRGSRKTLALRPGFQTTKEGKVVVFLVPERGKATEFIDLDGIREVDGEVLATSKHYIRAAIPPGSLQKATEIKGVRFIQRPIRSDSQRQIVSEGVSPINAVANHSRGVKGHGVKVAIIDAGFADGWLAYSLGELSDSTMYRDFTQSTNDSMFAGTGVHGTACAEIAYDVAPEAGFYLYKIGDLVDFENAKDACIANKIDIVSYSGSWLGTGFGDGQGVACEVVNDAADKGILWVNAAGNYADSQFSGLWADQEPNGWMNFADEGDELLRVEGVVSTGEIIDVWLTWNDWPTSTQDYDLYLYRIPNDGSKIERVAGSEDYQSFSDPVEHIEYEVTESGRYAIAVTKAENARTELLKIWSKNHALDFPSALVGTIGVPADARGSLSVGAVSYHNWTKSKGSIESYSSRGPTVDGRIKPDLVAPTGVSTYSYGTNAFFGTSAAAPHVAGAAALVKSANPRYTRSQLLDALIGATIDLGAKGKDNDYGTGKLVLPLLEAPTGPRISTLSSPSVRYGEVLTITGQGFGTSRGSGRVVFNGNVTPVASDYISWSDTEIVIRIPIGARKGEVRVSTTQGVTATTDLVVASPWIGSLSSSSIRTSQRLTVRGENFGANRGSSSVSVGSTLVPVASIAAWSDVSIVFTVPVNTPPGTVSVTTGQGRSNAVKLEVISPYLTSVTPTSAVRGAQVTLAGGNFGSSRGTNYVAIGSLRATTSDYITWNTNRIVVKVPTSAQTGDVKVVTENGESGGVRVQVTQQAVTVSVSTLTMDDTETGKTSEKTVTLTNTSSASLTVSSASLTGTDASQFRVSPTRATIAASGRQVFTVSFAPTTGGVKRASLSIAHNQSGSPAVVSLSGTATTDETQILSGRLSTTDRVFPDTKRYYDSYRVYLLKTQKLSLTLSTTAAIRIEGVANESEWVDGQNAPFKQLNNMVVKQDGYYRILVGGASDGVTGSYTLTVKASPGPLFIGAETWAKAVAYCRTDAGIDSRRASQPRLRANYPNPFNAETVISFSIPTPSNLRLVVYDLLGQKVRTLVEGEHQAGLVSVVWDGRDDQGLSVASGVYICHLEEAGADDSGSGFGLSIRMLLLR